MTAVPPVCKEIDGNYDYMTVVPPVCKEIDANCDYMTAVPPVCKEIDANCIVPCLSALQATWVDVIRLIRMKVLTRK